MAGQPTPGPWSVQDDCATSVWAGGHYIAETYTDGEANALLIAAAPELLTQLRGAVAMMRLAINGLDIDPDLTEIELRANGEHIARVSMATLLANGQAAIAKAEGR